MAEKAVKHAGAAAICVPYLKSAKTNEETGICPVNA